ncbi:MAG: hypothetical protein ACYDEQ_05425, partial [Desulfocucumaceae bacterium]
MELLHYVSNLVKEADVPYLAAALTASAVLVLLAGNKLRLPGGVELRGRAGEILQKTGARMSNDTTRTVLKKKIIQADLNIQPEYFAGLQYGLPVISLAVLLPPTLAGWIDLYWCVLAAFILYLAPG